MYNSKASYETILKVSQAKQAKNRLQFIIRQMQETENITDELKERNQMAWVQAMNSIYNRAEELVIHELRFYNKEK